MTLVEHKIN